MNCFRQKYRKIHNVFKTLQKQILFLGIIATINLSCIAGINRKQFILPKEWDKIDSTKTETQYRLKCYRREIKTCPRIFTIHDILLDRHESEATLEYVIKNTRIILNWGGEKIIKEKRIVESNFEVVLLNGSSKSESFKVAIMQIGTKEFIRVFFVSQREDFTNALPVFEKFWRTKIK